MAVLNLEAEAPEPLTGARESKTPRPDSSDGIRPAGVPKDYLLRWDGEYYGFFSDGDPLLVIGREIVLNGEINSCDMLVVEGRVEATIKACREIKITETGTFRGRVEFERADISGVFEGHLTAHEHLLVRATGRVSGTVRVGALEIERGGQVIGDIQVCGAPVGLRILGAVDELAK